MNFLIRPRLPLHAPMFHGWLPQFIVVSKRLSGVDRERKHRNDGVFKNILFCLDLLFEQLFLLFYSWLHSGLTLELSNKNSYVTLASTRRWLVAMLPRPDITPTPLARPLKTRGALERTALCCLAAFGPRLKSVPEEWKERERSPL